MGFLSPGLILGCYLQPWKEKLLRLRQVPLLRLRQVARHHSGHLFSFPLIQTPTLPTAHTASQPRMLAPVGGDTLAGFCLWRTGVPSSACSRALSSARCTYLALAKMGSFCLPGLPPNARYTYLALAKTGSFRLPGLPPQLLPWRLLMSRKKELEVYWKGHQLANSSCFCPTNDWLVTLSKFLYSATKTTMFPLELNWGSMVYRKTTWSEIKRPRFNFWLTTTTSFMTLGKEILFFLR